MSDEAFIAAWRKIMERAWEDEAFRQALADDPERVLAEAGVELPAGMNIVVVAEDEKRLHVVVPPPEDDGETA